MAKVYQHDKDGYFTVEEDDFGGSLPHNCVAVEPERKAGFIPRWNPGAGAWEQVEDHKGEEGYLDGKPHEIKEYGPLPEGFTAEPPPPTFDELRERKIAAIDGNTMRLINTGFRFTVGGEEYLFSYDQTDQGNFTKAMLVASAMPQDFPIAWRGWRGDTPHTLQVDASTMLALARAGMLHQAQLLAAGWALTNACRAATTPAELEAVVDARV